jgi:hypothetical protein
MSPDPQDGPRCLSVAGAVGLVVVLVLAWVLL